MPAIEGITQYFKQFYNTLANRRRYDRLPIEGVVNATWRNQYGQLVTRTCQSLDLSPNGLAAQSEEAAPVGADAYLHSSRHGLSTFALVCYCTPGEKGHRIGFQFRKAPEVWEGF